MKNQITVCMFYDVSTPEAAEFGDYERTGDDYRELNFDPNLRGLLDAAGQFVHWANQHIGPHERPRLDAGLHHHYVNEVIYDDDGTIDFASGETSYARVAINAPENWTTRQKQALNAAIERAFLKY